MRKIYDTENDTDSNTEMSNLYAFSECVGGPYSRL